MTSPPLIVSVGELARRLRLPQPLDEDARWTIEQAILDAQADVSAYLGRPLTPTTYTETGKVPWMGGYDLAHAPVLTIVSEVAETDTGGTLTGLFTVTYTAGIDAASDPELEPIRRFVRAHASASPTMLALRREVTPDLTRRISSLSVDGQAVTYEDTDTEATKPGSGAPGALPVLAMLDRWRVAGRRVSKRASAPGQYAPWPYDYTPAKHWTW